MARPARTAQKSDMVSTFTGLIANHPRLSAAVAFQIGVLLGQALPGRAGALTALKRSIGSAPDALVSALPDSSRLSGSASPRRTPRKRKQKAGLGRRNKA